MKTTVGIDDHSDTNVEPLLSFHLPLRKTNQTLGRHCPSCDPVKEKNQSKKELILFLMKKREHW